MDSSQSEEEWLDYDDDDEPVKGPREEAVPKKPEDQQKRDDVKKDELKKPDEAGRVDQLEEPDEPENVDEPQQQNEPENVDELQQQNESENVDELQQQNEPENVDELHQQNEPEKTEEPMKADELEKMKESEKSDEAKKTEDPERRDVEIIEEEQDWEVEKVLDMRVTDSGTREYLLAWKNWNGSPTWEPEDNCDCTLLIRKFEKQRSSPPQKKAKRSGKQTPTSSQKRLRLTSSTPLSSKSRSKKSSSPTSSESSIPSPPRLTSVEPFRDHDHKIDDDRGIRVFRDRKLKLEKIIGACSQPDLSLIVKWTGIDDPEKVALDVLRRFHPQEILDFLLEHIRYC